MPLDVPPLQMVVRLEREPEKRSEYGEQVALFDWANISEAQYPALCVMFATLNGVRLTPGLAVKTKRAGMRRGVPDVWLPYPAGKYRGLVFEMKIRGNKCTPEQANYLTRMKLFGWKTGVCYSFEEARDLIVNYLEER